MSESEFINAYDTYADAIFRHCYYRMGDRERGKELMQDTFVRVWEYIRKGNDIESVSGLLYRTANNLIVDHLRRKSKRTEQSFEDMQETGFDVASDEDASQSTRELLSQEQVENILNQIEEPYRSTVIMRYIDELSPAEIADILGESPNVISVRINRGMNKLRSLIQNHEV